MNDNHKTDASEFDVLTQRMAETQITAHTSASKTRVFGWAAITLDLTIATLLISAGLATPEQVCARVDEMQRRIAANPTGAFVASNEVTAILQVFKDAIGSPAEHTAVPTGGMLQ